ncbi:MAG TPA: exodeoxyribonuclease VII large subunit, partial [Nitrosospira sp.]|nr:exodeoxyribonuclease VII large subunit [Nitrosospira sp.]
LGCRLVHPGKRIEAQLAQLARLRERLESAWHRHSKDRYWRLRELQQRMKIASPDIPRLEERQRELRLRLQRAITTRMETLGMRLQRREANLSHLNPESVLARGYSIAYTPDGTVLRRNDQVDVGDVILVKFAKGWSKASVIETGE